MIQSMVAFETADVRATVSVGLCPAGAGAIPRRATMPGSAFARRSSEGGPPGDPRP